MTAEQYLAQNELGFEGDGFLKAEFQRLIDKYQIKTIIETGTYLGSTTLQLAKMVKYVFTIEINAEYFDKAAKKLMPLSNVINLFGNSIDILPKLLKESNTKLLVWLDAHWCEYNPLIQELAIIAQSGLKPVIIIHDFKVPEHPELGYDTYDGQDYDWSWIEQSVINIYGESNFTYHYNTQAEGAKRGVIFIEPK